MRILIIDDDESVLLALGRLLGEHDVVLSRGAQEGLEELRRVENVDAVVCDVSMPGLPGPALYAKIVRERPELARRFVFVSGNTYEAAKLLHAHLGPDSFVPPVLEKPVRRSVIVNALYGCR